jgi:signal transduction histidine kinase
MTNRTGLFLLNLAAVIVIMTVDWLTPAGVVVGILAGIPIVLSSFWDDPRRVWLTFAIAAVGFVVAAVLGRGPLSPAAVWIPNRILAFLTLPASAVLAILLQRRRLEAVRARDAAVAASELNRLLMSLLAHDLRSPLSVSNQAFEYVEQAVAEGRSIDSSLLADVRARLRRSLRAIEIVLDLARAELPSSNGTSPADALRSVQVREEIEAEVASFRHEAEVRNKRLVAELDRLGSQPYTVDALVLRQALAILLDNAIRYAVPGPVRVSADTSATSLIVRVRDSGPGYSARQGASSDGSGLGLKLCRSLLVRAGGRLDIERDAPDGTTFALHLPIAGASPAPTPEAALSAAT